MDSEQNLTPTKSLVQSKERASLTKQHNAVLWFTGLSGSGKSTLAYALEKRLIDKGHLSYVLDGDNVRMGLCGDLGFSADDRKENIRRIGELATLFSSSGIFTLTSFISPYKKDRESARTKAKSPFIEIFLDVPLQTCEQRDPKGLYKKVRQGQVKNFTGISSPYEKPENPEITLQTHRQSINTCVDIIISYLHDHGHFSVVDDNNKEQGQTK